MRAIYIMKQKLKLWWMSWDWMNMQGGGGLFSNGVGAPAGACFLISFYINEIKRIGED